MHRPTARTGTVSLTARAAMAAAKLIGLAVPSAGLRIRRRPCPVGYRLTGKVLTSKPSVHRYRRGSPQQG